MAKSGGSKSVKTSARSASVKKGTYGGGGFNAAATARSSQGRGMTKGGGGAIKFGGKP